MVFDNQVKKDQIPDFSRNIDLANKIVRSSTGQVETDYGVGLYKVNAPDAQGVAGFLKDAGPQQLADVAIICRNDYATIVAVALDGRPLRDSQRVLIQVGTTERPTGWTVRPTAVHDTPAFEVISYGNPPYQVENVDAVVTIANPHLQKATLLDINGMPTAAAVPVQRAGKSLQVTLPANTMYLVLTP